MKLFLFYFRSMCEMDRFIPLLDVTSELWPGSGDTAPARWVVKEQYQGSSINEITMIGRRAERVIDNEVTPGRISALV